jgi:drug/metabolite transporter (DMT)-like permease
VLASGAMGFGAVIVLQNAGIEHTSVSHAAVVLGAVPVLSATFIALQPRLLEGRDAAAVTGAAVSADARRRAAG